MSGFRRSLWLALAIAVAAPVAALSDADAPKPADQSKFEKWRQDPALFARLRAQAGAFLEMPPTRQEQLLKLDHDLHLLPPAQQKRLLAVARRYRNWLDRLPEADRQKIRDTSDPQARLQLIRDLRLGEWTARLPGKQKEKVQSAPPEERSRLVLQFRNEERQRRTYWKMHFQHWDELVRKQPMPATLADFPADVRTEVQTFVNEYLMHWLSPAEKTVLENAEGKWPAYPYTLVRLADKYPMALQGPSGPTRFTDLPVEVQKRLSAKVKDFNKTPMKKAEGKWPAYGIAVSTVARNRGIRLPYELWPSRHADLSPAVASFVDKKLTPLLSESEKTQLKNAESKWPLYPRTIQNLAAQHRLQVPWQTLPGLRERWDSYRVRTYRPPSTAPVPVVETQK
jgi:hypothetical protein